MKKTALFLVIAFLIFSCTLTKTLIYQKADIDDYKIFNNRTVEKGDHILWKTDENYNKYKISEDYLKEIKEIETVAYLVVYKGKILHEEYWDGYNSDSYTNSFSMAKSIIGLLIGFAIDDGFINNVDQKVSDFIPEFKKDDRDKITIKDLLTMSSGLYWGESYSSPFSRTARAYYGKNLYGIAKKLKLKSEPGKVYSYSSGDTQILSFIIEKATGKHVSDYASEKLWKPLGTKNNALWSLDKKNGNEKAYCCFNSNARDFAKIGQFMLQNGEWNGKQLLSVNYLKSSLTPASHLTYDDKPVDFYGYQWWILNYNDIQVCYARGLLGQYIMFIPEKEIVVVRLGHRRSAGTENGIPNDIKMWLDIALDMTGK